MSKPDWKDAPEWAQWLAMDSCGTWYWHEKRPVRREGEHEGGRDYWEPKAGFPDSHGARSAGVEENVGAAPVIPWQPPTPAETEPIREALRAHLRERNSRDEQQQERAAERVLERLWDRQ